MDGGGQREAARRQLELQVDQPVLLVFGGSQGARSLNQAITGQLEHYLRLAQVIHITGWLDEAWVLARRAELPPELQSRYHVSAYLHDEMVAALLSSDLVVSRAGASVLGEFPAVGLPAILVPYPHAGAHQKVNAQYLAGQQAAVVINDADLAQQLPKVVLNLITNQDKLQAMRRASQSLAQPDAATRLAQAIVEVSSYGRN
jgi:UDP-N-acetylglucosamine--N-acetylmuramyl-(pentapeptide) pyrophosphoryl-undecaprenol N-acetylglucosamine transferase